MSDHVPNPAQDWHDGTMALRSAHDLAFRASQQTEELRFSPVARRMCEVFELLDRFYTSWGEFSKHDLRMHEKYPSKVVDTFGYERSMYVDEFVAQFNEAETALEAAFNSDLAAWYKVWDEVVVEGIGMHIETEKTHAYGDHTVFFVSEMVYNQPWVQPLCDFCRLVAELRFDVENLPKRP